jgi:tellurite resistance protein TerC
MPAEARPEAGSASSPPRARDVAVTLACLVLGLGAGCVLWLRKGPEPAQQYLAGYLIELSLSADNVFVFAIIFRQFGVEAGRQRKLLFWGVAGAFFLRSAFLLAGIGAIGRFSWIVPVFGAVILATGVRLAASRGRRGFDPGGSPAARFLIRRIPASLAAVVALETADFIFALDSLPAVLAVTHDAAIAVASNLFAVLGLRSLFFVVSGAMRDRRYLNAGLAAVLSFVGVKMLAEPWFRMPAGASLAVIAALLLLSIGASLLVRRDRR